MAAPAEEPVVSEKDIRSRTWQGVWHDFPPIAEVLEWAQTCWENGQFRYMNGQVERGEKEQREHFQFTLYWDNPVRLSTCLNLRPGCKRIHYIPCMDRFKQTSTYTSKSDTRVQGPWEWGDKPNPGRRTDLRHVADLIRRREIRSMRQLDQIAPHMSVQYGRGFRDLIERCTPDRSWRTKGWFLWGPSGIGKTHGYENAGVSYYRPVVEPTTKHFSFYRYAGQPLVIFDDQSPSAMMMSWWLEMCNGGPLYLPVKGQDPVSFLAYNAVFISNDPPPDELVTQERWKRRWTVCHVQTQTEASLFWQRILATPGL